MLTQNLTNIKDFRENLSTFLDRVKSTREPLAVVRHGKPMVVVIPSETYDEFKLMQKHDAVTNNSRENLITKEVEEVYQEIKAFWKGKAPRTRPTQEDIDTHIF